jgi:hypothetical protein
MLPTFQDDLLVPSSRVRHSKGQLVGFILKDQALLGRLTLEDGNDRLSQKSVITTTLWRKPEILHPFKFVAVIDRLIY